MLCCGIPPPPPALGAAGGGGVIVNTDLYLAATTTPLWLNRVKMPDLDKGLFSGTTRVTEDDLAKCEVNNIGEDITNVLTSYDWEGGPAACILLQLSADNERVAAGFLITRGRDEKEYTIDASKIWQDANMGVTLTIRMPELDSFTFTDGGLTSDFLPDEECIHFFHATRDGGAAAPILSANLAQHGIGKFCTRIVCQISRASSAARGVMLKYTFMLFPASRAELLQMSERVTSGSWPGIKLGDGEMPLMPRPSENWGCPVLPLIRPGVSFSELGRAPGSAALRHAIAAIMRRCSGPESSRNAASLQAKWDKAQRNPAAFAEKEVPVTWPEQAQQAPTTGEHCQ